MTFTTLLVWLLIVEVLLCLIAVALFFGHGFWLRWYGRRREALLNEGRSMLHAVLAAYVAHGPTPTWFQSRPVRRLHAFPVRLQIRLFAELAPNLSGQQQRGLSALAKELGLIASAEAFCTSWLWWRRLRGARLLTLLGGGEHVMLPLFHDRELVVRAQAAAWGAGYPSRVVIDALVALLGDPSRLCRFTAQNALLQLSARTAPLTDPRLADQDRPSQMVLDALLTALHRFTSQARAPAPLRRRRLRGEPFARRADDHSSSAEAQIAAALEIATDRAEPRFLEPVLDLCAYPAPRIRVLAALFLGAMGGALGTERLLTLLTDSEAEVRATAAKAFGRLQHWPAAPRLALLLRDPSWLVRREAGLALRALGAPGVLFLRRALTDEDRFAADMARHILDLPGAVGSELSS